MTTIAEDLASVARSVIGADIPVRLRAFAERRMGVDQILCVRPTSSGDSRFPLTPDWIA
jgi:hypothetical protein